ncbi:trehalose-6-phosphate synthase [Aestuariivirga sp.]|uniref:alpha,alpha-trehalose-phosphate synthase (UDP-forming) n=1 Tax=Aestuariivirga sp. TaxID=2650926 RepID=UPI00391AABB5
MRVSTLLPMRAGHLLRYSAIGICLVLALAILALPASKLLLEQWSRSDVEARSRLVYSAVQVSVQRALVARDDARLASILEGVAQDDRILAVGLCDRAGVLTGATPLMPENFSCESVARTGGESFSSIVHDGRRVLVAAFPIAVREARIYLVVLHDLTYLDERVGQAQTYLIAGLFGFAFVIAGSGAVLIFLFIRRWIASLRQAIDDVREGRLLPGPAHNRTAIERQVQQLFKELEASRAKAEASDVRWSPQALHDLLSTALPDAQVIIISNREPYIHNRTETGIELQTPASGLVSALEPVMRACGGTWIAHGSGTADKETVDRDDRLLVPPSAPSYTLRRVWITEEEQNGYYYGLANEGLWPLCHIAFVRPTFRDEDWRYYKEINARFAQAVAREAATEDPIVLVQDYHFALAPRMIRELLPKATIITFWHIPWPNAETFGICPWKEEIIEGLLGSSILGFHTQFHCNNFLETVDRFIESRIDREHAAVTLQGHETKIRPYPISIEWPPAALEQQPPVEACRRRVRERLGIEPDMRIAVGIERFDYTKGILDRMRAIDVLLTERPEWKGSFVFVQVAAPTRSKLASYSTLQEEAIGLAQEINARHGSSGYQPIRLIVRHHEPHEVYELFRAADLCVVSSLHDGMNLVAKEFVASRDDEEGVLILSTFAGASRELTEALIVNPYDVHAMAESLQIALRMPQQEQRERMRLMRQQVKEQNVYRWAGRMLVDAARIRQRQRILALTEG